MTELKTLKDIWKGISTPNINYKGLEAHNIRRADFEIIKQEAIKWIKQLQTDHPYESKHAILTMDQYIKGQIDWIKLFFNITDEDLK